MLVYVEQTCRLHELPGRASAHQIDVLWEFTVSPGHAHRIVLECRRKSRPLEQNDALAFKGVVEEVGYESGDPGRVPLRPAGPLRRRVAGHLLRWPRRRLAHRQPDAARDARLEGGCYGKSVSATRSWILDFYNTYDSKTTRDVLICTSPSWWNYCSGGWAGMSAKSPLVVANRTSASSLTIPNGFPFCAFW